MSCPPESGRGPVGSRPPGHPPGRLVVLGSPHMAVPYTFGFGYPKASPGSPPRMHVQAPSLTAGSLPRLEKGRSKCDDVPPGRHPRHVRASDPRSNSRDGSRKCSRSVDKASSQSRPSGPLGQFRSGRQLPADPGRRVQPLRDGHTPATVAGRPQRSPRSDWSSGSLLAYPPEG
jgi:hypothetical protein